MTNQETCANCGHERSHHKIDGLMSELDSDGNRWNYTYCMGSHWVNNSEKYKHGKMSNDCPCKKFQSQNQARQSENSLGGNCPKIVERDKTAENNHSQDVLQGVSSRPDTRKGFISKAEVEKVIDDKTIEGFYEDNTQLWKEELKKRLGI